MGYIMLTSQVGPSEGLAIDLHFTCSDYGIQVSHVGCSSVGTKNRIYRYCLVSLGEASEEGMDSPHVFLL